MKAKTDYEIYEAYLNTFPDEEREILRPYLRDTFGFAAYALGVRGEELGEAIKEASKKAIKSIQDKM